VARPDPAQRSQPAAFFARNELRREAASQFQAPPASISNKRRIVFAHQLHQSALITGENCGDCRKNHFNVLLAQGLQRATAL
jgi:hypothetical protein